MDQLDALIAEHGAHTVMEAVHPLLSPERIARIEDVLAHRLASLTVVLEDLYDPHNAAAAVRSVEAFGLQTLHVVEGPSGPFRPAKDISLGGHKWLDLRRHRSSAECRDALRAAGFRLCATVPGAAVTTHDVDVSRPLAIFFGNEREGLSDDTIAACDERIAVPMHGFTQSFNLSVSVALVAERLSSRRRDLLGQPGDLGDAERLRLRARWHAAGIRGLREIVSRHVAARTRR